MKKSIRYGLLTGVGLILLFITAGIIGYWLVSVNKDPIKNLVKTQLDKQINGTITIGDININLFRTFPSIAVQLSDVEIRDSLWTVHHHQVLKASKIYATFHFLSLFSGKPKVNYVLIEDGSIHLYTDECGYCNLTKRDQIAFKKGNGEIPSIRFSRTRLIVENQFTNAYHDFDFKHLNCQVDKKDSLFTIKVSMESFVHNVGFNMSRGSYLTEKQMDGIFYLSFYPGHKVELNDVKLEIDHHPFVINGNIYLLNKPKSYELHVKTEDIPYLKATGLLTQTLQGKLNQFDITQSFDVDADISGLMAFRVIPEVVTHFAVEDSEMKTPAGLLTHCSFTGDFSNQADALKMPGDENSKFTFDNVKYTWENIPIVSTHLEVSNLKTPYMICDMRSNFELENLNQLGESSTIHFIKGLGSLDINYKGALGKADTLSSLINGTLTISEAEVNYMPRNLVFKNCSGVLSFKDGDLIIGNLLATAGQTRLTMNGDIKNMLAFLDKDPDRLTMNWIITTPDLHLSDFISYVSERVNVKKGNAIKASRVTQVSENLDRMISDGVARLNVRAGKLNYKKFDANDVSASVTLVGNKILLNNVKLKHAGGALDLAGSMINGNHANTLELKSNLAHVDIPGIFRAFDNFGQDAITSQNMKGKLNAKLSIKGVITDKAEVYENSMKGVVAFSIKEGELINFEPAMKIAATAFKNRDFSHILFGELTNELEINGSATTIHKMEIRSNVVVLFVEGVYDTKKGTDMSIQVPLSNLSKTENETLKNTGKVGLNIRLRAKTAEDGKLKVSWDPFNSAGKQRKGDIKSDSLQSSQVIKK